MWEDKEMWGPMRRLTNQCSAKYEEGKKSIAANSKVAGSNPVEVTGSLN
jgi:hypothetical protein